MTVPSTTRRAGPYLGNGVTTAFPFAFKVFSTSDIELIRTDADGISYSLVLDTDYSVALNPDQDASPGGTITYPLSGDPLADGETLVGVGALPYDQTTDLPSGGPYRAQTVETTFDRTVYQIQQLAEELGRALTLPPSAAGADTELPAPAASKLIGWNETADGLVNYSPADLATVVIAGTSYFQTFNGDGVQTQFVLTADPGSVNALDIALDGVPQKNGIDFTVSGTTLTFTTPPGVGTQNIAVRYVAALPEGAGGAADELRADLANGTNSAKGSALVGHRQDDADAAPTTVQAVLRRTVHVDDFGASATPGFDNTTAFLKAKAYCIANLPITLKFGRGVYEYAETGNWAYRGLTLEGEGMFATKLKCTTATSEHTALLFNAFFSGAPDDPFIDDCNVRYLTVEGNTNTLRVIRAQGISRSRWVDVGVRTAKVDVGYGFLFEGCSLNSFDHLACVNFPEDPFDSLPRWGLYLKNGVRAGLDIGQCTNNVFINRHMEYLPIGTQLEAADNNTFIGGTDESCTVYGLINSAGSRYNTFVGNGWENGESGATGDVIDGGYSNAYINCYSLHKIIFQGRSCRLDGGIHKEIEVQSGAEKNIVENCTVKYPLGSTVGFTDAGFATEWRNIYDQQDGQFVYLLKPRVNITVGASPFNWTNDTGRYVSVIMQAGTVSEVLIYRPGGGISYIAPTAAPNIYLLAPTEQIRFTYTVAPALSYMPQNGF